MFAANPMVVRFLSMIAASNNDEADKMLIPFRHLTKVLGLLVNPSITELDCTAFDGSSGTRKINNFLLEHALKHCLKIRKIKLLNSNSFRMTSKRDQLPVKRFKSSWSNLTIIKSHNDYMCNEKTLKLIRENFPNIELVSLSIEDETNIC